MSLYLCIFVGYILGRLDANYGRAAGFWLGTWCRWPIIQLRKIYNRITVKPYPVGFKTGYYDHVVKGRQFCWEWGHWSYQTNKDCSLSHGLIDWYERNT